jgi:hypothetical protein
MKFSSVVLIAGTIMIAPGAYAKHASFDMPACDKLIGGQGPSAKAESAGVDGAATAERPVEHATTDGTAAQAANNKNVVLQPLKLTEDKDSFSVSADGKMKVEVQQNVAAQSGEGNQVEPGSTKSIIENDKKIAEKLIKDARKVKIGPTPLLVESDEELQKKNDALGDAEKTELTDLWSATINRSPDIQFVINRLQPTSDPNHATATAMKLVAGALFNAVQAVPMMMGPGMNSMMMYSGIGSGWSIIQNLLAGQDAKKANKQAISQEQATMLYKIVRDTADKLVLEFRSYKRSLNDLDRAQKDVEDLKTMVASTRAAQDAAKQIEMEYTIRKAQRDADNLADSVRLHRQSLVDLAGADAVDKLDGQIVAEAEMLKRLTGGEMIAEPLDAAPKGPQVAADKNKKTF